MTTWVKCTDENGQTIYANLDNAITLFRDEFGIEARIYGRRHRGKRYARPNPEIG